jgi:hypothetical protein
LNVAKSFRAGSGVSCLTPSARSTRSEIFLGGSSPISPAFLAANITHDIATVATMPPANPRASPTAAARRMDGLTARSRRPSVAPAKIGAPLWSMTTNVQAAHRGAPLASTSTGTGGQVRAASAEWERAVGRW